MTMARRIISIAIVLFLLVAVFTAPAYCQSPGRKLARGLCNTCLFPAEIYYQYVEVNDSDGLFAAVTWGALKGLGMSLVRLGAGVYETITFPFPIPEDYMPILTNPEFVGENLTNSI